MPSMIRGRNKGTKIAMDILGVPFNMQRVKPVPKEQRIMRQLNYQESYIGKMR